MGITKDLRGKFFSRNSILKSLSFDFFREEKASCLKEQLTKADFMFDV